MKEKIRLSRLVLQNFFFHYCSSKSLVSIKRAYETYPWIGTLLPALGYSAQQLKDLEMSINGVVDCDAVVFGTPADLRARIQISKPAARVRFEGKDTAELAFSQYLDKIFAEMSKRLSF